MFKRPKKEPNRRSKALTYFEIDGERIEVSELFNQIHIKVLDEDTTKVVLKLNTAQAKELIDRLSIFDV